MLDYQQAMPKTQRSRLIAALGIPLRGKTYFEIIAEVENHLLQSYEQAVLPDAHPESVRQLERFQSLEDASKRTTEVFLEITGIHYPFIQHFS